MLTANAVFHFEYRFTTTDTNRNYDDRKNVLHLNTRRIEHRSPFVNDAVSAENMTQDRTTKSAAVIGVSFVAR